MFANTANKLAQASAAVQSPAKRLRLTAKSSEDNRHVTWKLPVATTKPAASPLGAILAGESPRPVPSASPSKPQPSPSPSPSTSAKSPLFSPAPDTVTERVNFNGKAALELLRDAAKRVDLSTKEIPVSFKL